jgi:hypothetical protein
MESAFFVFLTLSDHFHLQVTKRVDSYKPGAVTFVATKTDEISCSEAISTLGLQRDARVCELEATIEKCKSHAANYEEHETEMENRIQGAFSCFGRNHSELLKCLQL